MRYEVSIEMTNAVSPWVICITQSESEALQALQGLRHPIQRIYLRMLSDTGDIVSFQCRHPVLGLLNIIWVSPME